MQLEPTTRINRILIVDDEDPILEVFSIALASPSREIIGCESGAVALHELSKSPVDLVLLDLRMPGRSGIDVLREMRERGDLTRVILCSAFIPEHSFIQALRLGVTTFINKPVRLTDLREIVANALNQNWDRDLGAVLDLAEKLNFTEAAKLLSSGKIFSSDQGLSSWKKFFKSVSRGENNASLIPIAKELLPLTIHRA